jgi:effector-binding domain-containing protein
MADPGGSSSKIDIKSVQAKDTATVRETIAPDAITETLGRIYQAVHASLAKQGIKPNGAPFARYHEFGAQIDIEAGMPVERAILTDGNVKPSQLPGGLAAVTIHVGPYESLSGSYDAITAWMTNTGRVSNGGPWELYLTDPSSEPNPAKWLTQIIWPLRPA